MIRAFRLVLPLLALGFVSCAAASPERLAQLEETQAHDRQVLDLRVTQVEERVGHVENGLNQVRGTLAESAPRKAAPRKAAPRSNERLPAQPVVTGTAVLNDVPSVPVLPYLPRTDLLDVSGGVAAPRPAAAPASGAEYSAGGPAYPGGAPLPGTVARPGPAPLQNAALVAPVASVASADNGPGLEPVQFAPEAKNPPRRAARAASGGKTGSAAYDAALALYNKGEYAKAQQDFTAFAQASPGSPLAANALYWLGECQYSLGKYDQAIMTFKDVAAKYPKHAKAAAALLKAGYAYERLGDMENARFYWQLLLDDFPNSSPAGLARKKMGSA